LKSSPIAAVLLLLLVTSINVQAQAAFAGRGELPNCPSTSFWTKMNTTLLALDAAAKGADFYYTMRGMGHPGGGGGRQWAGGCGEMGGGRPGGGAPNGGAGNGNNGNPPPQN